MMFLPNKADSHLIDHGRVMCPLHGDIDVEKCFDCRSLKSIQLDGPEPRVSCEALRMLPWGTPADFALLGR
jgi:hypothetical protein